MFSIGQFYFCIGFLLSAYIFFKKNKTLIPIQTFVSCFRLKHIISIHCCLFRWIIFLQNFGFPALLLIILLNEMPKDGFGSFCRKSTHPLTESIPLKCYMGLEYLERLLRKDLCGLSAAAKRLSAYNRNRRFYHRCPGQHKKKSPIITIKHCRILVQWTQPGVCLGYARKS